MLNLRHKLHLKAYANAQIIRAMIVLVDFSQSSMLDLKRLRCFVLILRTHPLSVENILILIISKKCKAKD